MNTKLLRIALAKKEMPQIAVARAIGVDHSTFSRWTRGWYPVPDQYRKKLAEVLGVDEASLFPDQKQKANSVDNKGYVLRKYGEPK